ncbi:MAG: DUF4846 domain-containing protein [Aureispira sp.]
MKLILQRTTSLGTLSVIIWCLLACQPTTVSSGSTVSNTTTDTLIAPLSPINTDTVFISKAEKKEPPPVAPKPTITALPTPSNPLAFPWLNDYNPTSCILQQVPTPEGYQRLDLTKNSFGYWLRQLPLHPEGTPVLLYNGATKPYQAGAYRVLNIDIGKRDLQQCADAVMRLRAEYLYHQKAYENIHFKYTSGHTIRFSDWSKGKRPKVSGSKVLFSSPQGQTDVSYKQFKRYLTNVYCYAGTASLSKEMPTKALSNIQSGDVFIQGGFPGHAILVMDVAHHPETGERLFLLAQSYMPAQSIHLLNNPTRPELSPWYSNDFTGLLATPEWNFYHTDLRQFEE